MLQDRIYSVEQRKEQEMVSLVRQQERRLRHGYEEIQEHGACRTLKVLDIGRNVVDDGEERRMKRLESPIATR